MQTINNTFTAQKQPVVYIRKREIFCAYVRSTAKPENKHLQQTKYKFYNSFSGEQTLKLCQHALHNSRISVGTKAISAPEMKSEQVQKKNFSNANFPTDAEGRVYHLGVKRGEVANRILSVGDTSRARILSELLDPPMPGESAAVFERTSSRGFTVFTGRRGGVPVSIISTGMGTAMMDFVVREARAIVDGGMAIVRLGTCGLLDGDLPVGSLVVASKGSVSVRRDPDAFHTEDDSDFNDSDEESDFVNSSIDQGGPRLTPSPYWISRRVSPDQALSERLLQLLQCRREDSSSQGPVVGGLNASACSFYSSQARQVDHFDDRNEDLMDVLNREHPEVTSLEMETFHLLDLARCSRGTIQAAACAIGLAQRKSNDFLPAAQVRELELIAGEAALDSLMEHTIEDDKDGGCSDPSVRVW